MKILIADKFPETSVDGFIDLGCEVIYRQDLKDDLLLEEMKSSLPDVLVVRSTKVTGDMIEANPSLSLIIRAGAGYNTIDVETSSRRGVYVANCPGKNAIAVAELAMGLIMSIDRRIPGNVIDLKAGCWNKQEYSKSEGLYGKTLGIIGTGRIGQEVILRARAFGMEVVAWSRSLSEEMAEKLGIRRCENIYEVAALADYVSLHLALSNDTRGIIGERFLTAMKDGAALINTSRAEIVDEIALMRALDEKGIKAGLDVYSEEPAGSTGKFMSPLTSHHAVYGTHHIGASTNQAQRAVADETLEIVKAYLYRGSVRNCVNLIEQTEAKYALTVRHQNKVGVLSEVLQVLRKKI